ncbi:MAG: NAAT family transporter [Methanoregulaceae archaeon]|jgi:multiple antibiotic resistance protein|nr:NAAT family transporter [Methanoregulaceae archaeon]
MTPPLQFGLLAFSSMIAMLDPIATAPLFVDLTKNTPDKRKQIAFRACMAAGVTLLLFAIAGGAIFSFFGITVPAFQIVGGLLLAISSMRHLSGSGGHAEEVAAVDDPSIVPLGIPLIAGAGSISTVMVLSGQARAPMHQAALILSIVICVVLVFITLRAAPVIIAKLGQSGQEILSKVLALLTAVIGVQFIVNGATTVLRDMLKHLG